MRKNHESAVHRAVMIGSLVEAKRAIAEGEQVDSLDGYGRTPLFYAAGDDLVEVVSELIEHGADLNIRDRNLETPRHFAAREYRVEVAVLLIRSGATVDVQNLDGNTPLSHAVFASRGRGEMIHLLLSSGADRAMENKYGVSPEGLAKTIANFDVGQFLAGSTEQPLGVAPAR